MTIDQQVTTERRVHVGGVQAPGTIGLDPLAARRDGEDGGQTGALAMLTMLLQRVFPLSVEKRAGGLALVSAGVQVQTKSGPHPLGASARRRAQCQPA